MPLEDQLAAALTDRYTIERELGRGGMATVYLARDVRHQRQVAVKVLRPELATVVGWERFLTEIRLTARLEHPHILTLIDSGESGAFLWYAVPYVRGESLRARLLRERQLAIPEVLRIARQIAAALSYAHQQGVIHRDVKPENILLHEGEAILADFGIARALAEAGGERLTQSGQSLGTPQYMSPEQATGDPLIGARSDQYSLAAVVYEMLAGEPPFSGPTAQAVIAKLLVERPVALRTLRETVPSALEAAVMGALKKSPADRFATVEAFAAALEVQPQPITATGGPSSNAGLTTLPSAQHSAQDGGASWRMRGWRGGLVLGGLMLTLVVGGRLLLHSPAKPAPPSAAPASSLVMIVPFRTAGADSSLQYLGEGMVDLLAGRLNGAGGIRVVDPYAAVSAWRHRREDGGTEEAEALAIARGQGADYAITAKILGRSQRLTVAATILGVVDGRQIGATSVTAPAESLLVMVDRLAVELLSRQAGASDQRLSSLSREPLAAVRAYLDGMAAYRRGHYEARIKRVRQEILVGPMLGGVALQDGCWC